MLLSRVLPCLLAAGMAQLTVVLGQLTITVSGPRIDTTYREGSLFGGPFANLPSYPINGSLYYFDDIVCQPPPRPNFHVYNVSILIVENSQDCIQEKISFARLAGYNMLLTYTQNDSNFVISDEIIGTGFPFAIIHVSTAEELIANGTVRAPNDTSYVSVQGNVVSGVILISFIVIFFISFVCCCCIWALICCKLYCEESELEREMRFLETQRTGDYPSRQELIESIMRHLQQLELDIGAQTPLGEERTRALPSRNYKASEERDTTCAICVEDYRNGERVKELPCKHIFHPVCIDEWLINHSSLCPLCKENLRVTPEHPFPHQRRLLSSSDDEGDTDSEGSRRALAATGSRTAYGATALVTTD